MAHLKQNHRLCRSQAGLDPETSQSPLSVVNAYHQRSKHGTHGYAAGPASLDWDAQPNPYRRYEGCSTLLLPFCSPEISYASLFENHIPATPLNLNSIAQLLEYALSLSAIKVFGADSWTVRCNPSSGNLHPTEAYLVCGQLEHLQSGVYHYQSERHQLARRARLHTANLDGHAYIVLSSVHWREAWKYGERAFRYCQLDIGHALAALRYSAAMLGWQLNIESSITDEAIAALCGIDRTQDFDGVEPETPDVLLRIGESKRLSDVDVAAALEGAEWFGRPSLLDPRPFYEWKIIDQVSLASRKIRPTEEIAQPTPISRRPTGININAAQLIKQRRSALAFQSEETMDQHSFFSILSALLPHWRALPFDILPHAPRVHPVLFIHRVEDIAPGLYCLPRNENTLPSLTHAMRDQFLWQQINEQLPVYLLQEGDARQISKQISCHQAIASDSAFSLGMLAEFNTTLSGDTNAWRYRELYWEAGLLGQALYLEAEARGYRGTGIGCFLDDLFHELLGLKNQQFQSLYHFTVGTPVVDSRITTLSPYSGRNTS